MRRFWGTGSPGSLGCYVLPCRIRLCGAGGLHADLGLSGGYLPIDTATADTEAARRSSVSGFATKDRQLDNTDLGLLPLVPFGWMDYPRPERGPHFIFSNAYYRLWVLGKGWENTSYRSFKPMEDLASATAEELRASGLFQEVVMAPHATQGDLILKGAVKSTRYYATVISYGLSFANIIPWVIGLPSGKLTNELSIKFSLEDSDTHTVLWHKAYTETYDATYWLSYYHLAQFKYAALYKTMLRDVVQNLRQQLTSHP